MFQDDALFPHRDVAANVAFGLRMQGVTRRAAQAEPGRRAAGARRPRGSRAPRRRVALGRRAAAGRAGARARADATRADARRAARRARPRPARSPRRGAGRRCSTAIGQTAVYVTHDVAEAFALGKRVAVMRAGRSSRSRPPSSSGPTPADAWVARFIGIAEHRRARRVDARHASRRCHAPDRPGRECGRRRGPSRRPSGHAARSVRRRPEIVSAHAGLAAPCRHAGQRRGRSRRR